MNTRFSISNKRCFLLVSIFFYAIICRSQSGQAQQEYNTSIYPIPDFVKDVKVSKLSLNGQWIFNGNKSIIVPGECEMQGHKISEGEKAVYSRNIFIPKDWKNKLARIRFDAVNFHCIVKLNGIVVREHEGGFVPFEADITHAIKKNGSNLLVVEVMPLTISDLLNCTSQYAAHTVVGILRKVTLYVVPPTYIVNETANTSFNEGYTNGILNIKSTIACPIKFNSTTNLKLIYVLSDSKGQIIVEKSFKEAEILNGRYTVITNIKVSNPMKWDTEHPNLYTFKTEILEGNTVIERKSQKIGFRQIVVKGNQLLINGMPVKLHGVNRHEIYPLTGRSVTAALCREDAVLFKRGNCNYIRTAHYPPSEEFLDAADELGLFVESESALCWIGHGASPLWNKWNYNNYEYHPVMIQANIEKMVAQQNHPSIIIWSLGNESLWSPLWDTINNIVKKMDTTRPTTFHDQCWGGFNNLGSKADIAVHHYPGIAEVKASDTMNRPVLFGEFAHVSCYNRREILTDPGIRAMYGAPLAQMYDSMYIRRGCLGGAIWSGIDDIFTLPNGINVGCGAWGVIDGWRRLKPEYYGMKKAFSPIVIKRIDTTLLVNGYLQLEIENRYDFSSLKENDIFYTINNGQLVKLDIDVKPREIGFLKIKLKKSDRYIAINFFDKKKNVITSEFFGLKNSIAQSSSIVKLSAVETNSIITIKQGDTKYVISKQTGAFLSIENKSGVVVNKGINFCVVPLNADDGGKPNFAGESFQNAINPLYNYPLATMYAEGIKITTADTGITMTMQKVFRNAHSIENYLFTNDGKLIVKDTVQYEGYDSLPRQYGLLLELPKSFDRLSWQCNNTNYNNDKNNPARSSGYATAGACTINPGKIKLKAPFKSWKDDDNELGSNDFRSTKINIIGASLTDINGNGIKILSDGHQCIRSWLQDGNIQLLVAQYNNTGSEPFYSFPHGVDKINIKRKKISCSVTLQINKN